MATSGSYDAFMSLNDILRGAALKLKAIPAAAQMSALMTADFKRELNAMLRAWSVRQIHVWKVAEATMFPQVGQVRYTIGAGATDHVTLATAVTETAIATAAADGATTITVDSASGISSGDNIGVQVDDGTIHWTTVSGAPVGAVITLASALDDSAQVGNSVFAYTNKLTQPLKIVHARRKNLTSGIEVPLGVNGGPMGRIDYLNLAQKTVAGTINQYFFDRQLAPALLYLYQVPSAIDEIVNFTCHLPIQDFDSAANDPDIPAEWGTCLVFNLALLKATEFSVPDSEYAKIERMAVRLLDDMEGADREEGSIFFEPDTEGC